MSTSGRSFPLGCVRLSLSFVPFLFGSPSGLFFERRRKTKLTLFFSTCPKNKTNNKNNPGSLQQAHGAPDVLHRGQPGPGRHARGDRGSQKGESLFIFIFFSTGEIKKQRRVSCFPYRKLSLLAFFPHFPPPKKNKNKNSPSATSTRPRGSQRRATTCTS